MLLLILCVAAAVAFVWSVTAFNLARGTAAAAATLRAQQKHQQQQQKQEQQQQE